MTRTQRMLLITSLIFGGVSTVMTLSGCSSGVNCWDLNGNGEDDPAEDVNGDGIFDTADCQGAPGVLAVQRNVRRSRGT